MRVVKTQAITQYERIQKQQVLKPKIVFVRKAPTPLYEEDKGKLIDIYI